MPDIPLNPDALEAACLAAIQNESLGATFADEEDRRDWLGWMRPVVSAYLAAALPEVNSVEELEALPINSLVLDRFDYPHHKCAQSKPDFTNLRTGHFISRGEFYFPARVLYRPEVKP